MCSFCCIRIPVYMILASICGISASNKAKEYCPGEVFTPDCGHDAVVIINHAFYGRMAAGRCANVAEQTCVKDVLYWMHQRCSGKSTCTLKIVDYDLNKLMPCTKDYMPYLEANFTCLPVVTSTKSQCSQQNTIHVRSKTLSLSSEVSRTSGCGLPEAPWTLQAQPGQYMTFHLQEFTEENTVFGDNCAVKYGYIVDVDAGEMVDICRKASRDDIVYISKGHVVQVVFQDHILQKHTFLLKVTANGCPDFIPPNNAWMRKEDHRIIIGCHGSSVQWTLRCTGSRWIGTYGQCPDDTLQPRPIKYGEDGKLPTVIALTLIIGTTLVICCVAATSIIVFFCYRKYKVGEKQSTDYFSESLNEQNIELPNGTILSVKTLRPGSTVQRGTGTRSVPGEAPRGTLHNTLPNQNFLEEVIYDDPANLDISTVEYVNQFQNLTCASKNSLQYTKLQKT